MIRPSRPPWVLQLLPSLFRAFSSLKLSSVALTGTPRPTLVQTPDGKTACDSCKICEAACPTQCISVLAGKAEPKDFTIDFGRCIRCGICIDVCPQNALARTRSPLPPVVKRQDLVLNKKALLSAANPL